MMSLDSLIQRKGIPLGHLSWAQQACRRCALQALRAEDGLCYPGAGSFDLAYSTSMHQRVQACRYTHSDEPCQAQGTDDY
jgi:hypothetical protein